MEDSFDIDLIEEEKISSINFSILTINTRSKHNHNMKLRSLFKFKPIHAKTAKLEGFAIPKIMEHPNLKHKSKKILKDMYIYKLISNTSRHKP